MKVIRLDARKWVTGLDFYDAVLEVLRAPAWHGRSVDALIDSIGIGKINEIEPPFRLEIAGIDHAGKDAVYEMMRAFCELQDYGAEIKIDESWATFELSRRLPHGCI